MYCIEVKTANLAVLNAIKAVASLDKNTKIDEFKSEINSIDGLKADVKDTLEKIEKGEMKLYTPSEYNAVMDEFFKKL